MQRGLPVMNQGLVKIGAKQEKERDIKFYLGLRREKEGEEPH